MTDAGCAGDGGAFRLFDDVIDDAELMGLVEWPDGFGLGSAADLTAMGPGPSGVDPFDPPQSGLRFGANLASDLRQAQDELLVLTPEPPGQHQQQQQHQFLQHQQFVQQHQHHLLQQQQFMPQQQQHYVAPAAQEQRNQQQFFQQQQQQYQQFVQQQQQQVVQQIQQEEEEEAPPCPMPSAVESAEQNGAQQQNNANSPAFPPPPILLPQQPTNIDAQQFAASAVPAGSVFGSIMPTDGQNKTNSGGQQLVIQAQLQQLKTQNGVITVAVLPMSLTAGLHGSATELKSTTTASKIATLPSNNRPPTTKKKRFIRPRAPKRSLPKCQNTTNNSGNSSSNSNRGLAIQLTPENAKIVNSLSDEIAKLKKTLRNVASEELKTKLAELESERARIFVESFSKQNSESPPVGATTPSRFSSTPDSGITSQQPCAFTNPSVGSDCHTIPNFTDTNFATANPTVVPRFGTNNGSGPFFGQEFAAPDSGSAYVPNFTTLPQQRLTGNSNFSEISERKHQHDPGIVQQRTECWSYSSIAASTSGANSATLVGQNSSRMDQNGPKSSRNLVEPQFKYRRRDCVDFIQTFENVEKPFASTSCVVEKLVPFHIYQEPDFNATFLESVDTELTARFKAMKGQQNSLEKRLRAAFLKEALAGVEVRNRDRMPTITSSFIQGRTRELSELCLIDFLLSTNEKRLIEEDAAAAAQQNLEEFVANSEVINRTRQANESVDLSPIRSAIKSSPDSCSSSDSETSLSVDNGSEDTDDEDEEDCHIVTPFALPAELAEISAAAAAEQSDLLRSNSPEIQAESPRRHSNEHCQTSVPQSSEKQSKVEETSERKSPLFDDENSIEFLGEMSRVQRPNSPKSILDKLSAPQKVPCYKAVRPLRIKLQRTGATWKNAAAPPDSQGKLPLPRLTLRISKRKIICAPVAPEENLSAEFVGLEEEEEDDEEEL